MIIHPYLHVINTHSIYQVSRFLRVGGENPKKMAVNIMRNLKTPEQWQAMRYTGKSVNGKCVKPYFYKTKLWQCILGGLSRFHFLIGFFCQIVNVLI